MNSSRWKNNIKIAYALSLINELYFPITVWLFFYLRYLDFKQIAVIAAVQVIASNVFEIPTGAFADVIGKKVSIFLSFAMYSIVMLAFAFTTSFWVFVLLETLRGLSNALYSGSLEALTYDTLKENKSESEYDKVIANIESSAWIGLFCAAILGGFLYHFWFRAPYILQAIIFAFGAFFTLVIKEPHSSAAKHTLSARVFVKQNIQGFKEIFKNARSSQISIVFIILGSGYFIAASILGISQAKEYGMDSRGVGLLFGTGYILSALVSQLFPKLKRVIGSKSLLFFTAVGLLGSFLFAQSVGIILGSLLIILRIASSAIFRNIRSSIINQFVDSKNRATSISTIVLLSQLPFAILSYAIGNSIDATSPNAFAYVLGLSLLGILVLQQIAFSVLKIFNK